MAIRPEYAEFLARYAGFLTQYAVTYPDAGSRAPLLEPRKPMSCGFAYRPSAAEGGGAIFAREGTY